MYTEGLLLSMPGPYELVVIFLVVLLVFGAGKLPEIGRLLGKGIREFKKSLHDDVNSHEDDGKKQ
jgi:sec-independent protein translocase protein TatA